jgi:hypothetical protein
MKLHPSAVWSLAPRLNVGLASNSIVQPSVCQRPFAAVHVVTGTDPSNHTVSLGQAWMVSCLFGGITTDSWYVPARRTIVAPDRALDTAASTERSGASCEPALVSRPDGDTTIAPAGTGYAAVPTVVPAPPIAREPGSGEPEPAVVVLVAGTVGGAGGTSPARLGAGCARVVGVRCSIVVVDSE